ncbi:Tox-REase-5 domain-containing protein [Corallococcus sp. RDP092CA]|uniref:Tox-REase-5 domain-containing protein n=1 Tax=Corallococcus sp. RDP092CA TaxID=3109369 RepID=UPI0035B0C016
MTRRWAVWLWLLWPVSAWAEDVPEVPPVEEDAPPGEDISFPTPEEVSRTSSQERPWNYLTRVEAGPWALWPQRGGEAEGFMQVEPMLVLDGGEKFGANLGGPVRFRLRGGEGAGRVRKEDWDTLSDFGQLVRALKLGADSSPVALWVGQMEGFHLLSGHLVRRYSNLTNPDYHPAGALLTAMAGPLYVEGFASDVLAARLMAAEVEVDVQHVLFGKPRKRKHYTLSLSVAHDFARVSETSRRPLLAHLDGTAVLWLRKGREVHVVAGWGGRPGEGGAWGAVAGIGLDVVTPQLDLLARLEVRRQHGGFRQGYFGADYELARFQAAGTSGLPLAEAPFPDGYSVQTEASVAWDAELLDEVLHRHLRMTVGVEAFSWGRLDADWRLGVQLLHRNVELAVKGLAVGAEATVPVLSLSAEGVLVLERVAVPAGRAASVLSGGPGAAIILQRANTASKGGAPAQGPGQWGPASESMSARARRYQEQITGHSADEAYWVGGVGPKSGGVKFDGFKDGVLLEAKGPGYAKFFEGLEPKDWFRHSGAKDLIEQADRQSKKARGSGGWIEWHVAEEKAAAAIRSLLREAGVEGVKVLHTPAH